MKGCLVTVRGIIPHTLCQSRRGRVGDRGSLEGGSRVLEDIAGALVGFYSHEDWGGDPAPVLRGALRGFDLASSRLVTTVVVLVVEEGACRIRRCGTPPGHTQVQVAPPLIGSGKENRGCGASRGSEIYCCRMRGRGAVQAPFYVSTSSCPRMSTAVAAVAGVVAVVMEERNGGMRGEWNEGVGRRAWRRCGAR